MINVLSDIFYGGNAPVTDQVYHCHKVAALRQDAEQKENALMEQLSKEQPKPLFFIS